MIKREKLHVCNMPFANRVIKPVRLGKARVDKESQFDLGIHVNAALVGTLKQLSDLALQAEQLFGEITTECCHVVDRTKRLQGRVDEATDAVNKFPNPKTVKVRKYSQMSVNPSSFRHGTC